MFWKHGSMGAWGAWEFKMHLAICPELEHHRAAVHRLEQPASQQRRETSYRPRGLPN